MPNDGYGSGVLCGDGVTQSKVLADSPRHQGGFPASNGLTAAESLPCVTSRPRLTTTQVVDAGVAIRCEDPP